MSQINRRMLPLCSLSMTTSEVWTFSSLGFSHKYPTSTEDALMTSDDKPVTNAAKITTSVCLFFFFSADSARALI